MMLGLVTAMLPWWIRNAYVMGHFVPTMLQVGASLYDGLNPKPPAASNMEEFVPRFAAEERRAAASTARDGRSRRIAARTSARSADAGGGPGLGWANPGRTLILAGVKFLRMWNVWPNEPRLCQLADPFGGVFHVYPVADFCHNWRWRTLTGAGRMYFAGCRPCT